MDRDNITRTGARAPGVERLSRSHGGVAQSVSPALRLSPKATRATRDAKVGSKLWGTLIDPLHPGRPRLIGRPWSCIGENPPYGILGGDDGNVGIIRSPVRAIVLPDSEELDASGNCVEATRSDSIPD